MSYLCLVCDAPVEQDPDTIDLRWRHERPGAFGHGAQPDFDRTVEAKKVEGRKGIIDRAKANEILLVCYPAPVVNGLDDNLAIDVANIIAKACDRVRGL